MIHLSYCRSAANFLILGVWIFSITISIIGTAQGQQQQQGASSCKSGSDCATGLCCLRTGQQDGYCCNGDDRDHAIYPPFTAAGGGGWWGRINWTWLWISIIVSIIVSVLLSVLCCLCCNGCLCHRWFYGGGGRGRRRRRRGRAAGDPEGYYSDSSSEEGGSFPRGGIVISPLGIYPFGGGRGGRAKKHHNTKRSRHEHPTNDKTYETGGPDHEKHVR